jgi:hypothetical protein
MKTVLAFTRFNRHNDMILVKDASGLMLEVRRDLWPIRSMPFEKEDEAYKAFEEEEQKLLLGEKK